MLENQKQKAISDLPHNHSAEEEEEVVEEPTEETEPVEFSEKSASRYETVKSFLSGE